MKSKRVSGFIWRWQGLEFNEESAGSAVSLPLNALIKRHDTREEASRRLHNRG